jgi:signal transduction histidine kinase
MSRVPRPTPSAWRLLAAMAALTSVLVVALAPPSAIALDLPALHAALDSASVVIAIVVTFLFCGRYLRTGRVDDLLLATGLAVSAATSLVSTAVAVANLNGVVLSAWAPVVGQVTGAILVCAAALSPPRVLHRARGHMVRVAAASSAGFALLLAVLSVLLPHLPEFFSGAHAAGSAPILSGTPGLLSTQALIAVCMAVAALGFSRRAEREDDRLAHWLALSCIIGAVARIDFLFYPSLYTQWVSIGDVLRVGRFAILLYAGCQEISGYWQSQSAMAVLEERRRLARDMHDGVAQELTFILRRARRGAEDDPTFAQIAAAADRALLDSRRAIAALSLPIDERFDIVLGRIAEETAGRAGARVDLDLDAAEVDHEHAEALIRIVAEAVQNATRHGGAGEVRVELTAGPAIHLRVTDNGTGFDPAAVAARGGPGFGLVSMRQRAEAIGGAFTIASAPGDGTVVEVRLP